MALTSELSAAGGLHSSMSDFYYHREAYNALQGTLPADHSTALCHMDRLKLQGSLPSQVYPSSAFEGFENVFFRCYVRKFF